MKKVLVQKYGGVTVADPEKIKSVAKSIYQLSQKNLSLIVVVSAMGKTTNELIALAQKISTHPEPREMDMLLSTGERISMALMSMALHDLGATAISFTGSQSGIMTNDSHINAQIQDVKAFRVQEALEQNKIVVLAGFQGVSPKTKEITTLGRGGSDTTAVALAAAFGAERCEILKEVIGVMTADPKKVANAKKIEKLNYQQMLDMTFSGAQVLHYRSVELAALKKVPLFVGTAASSQLSYQNMNPSEGTMISEEKNNSYESSKPLAVNSHSQVLKFFCRGESFHQTWDLLLSELRKQKISFPQLLFSEKTTDGFVFFTTGAAEWIQSVIQIKDQLQGLQLTDTNICSVSLTCTGVTQPELFQKVCGTLSKENISIFNISVSGMSISVFIEMKNEAKALNALHSLIDTN